MQQKMSHIAGVKGFPRLRIADFISVLKQPPPHFFFFRVNVLLLLVLFRQMLFLCSVMEQKQTPVLFCFTVSIKQLQCQVHRYSSPCYHTLIASSYLHWGFVRPQLFPESGPCDWRGLYSPARVFVPVLSPVSPVQLSSSVALKRSFIFEA